MKAKMQGKIIIVVWMIVVVKFKCTSSSIDRPPNEQAVATIPGDFVIGLFVSAHHIPKGKPDNSKDFLKCGEIREHYGIQRTEIALRTIDEINNNKDLLSKIKLGIEIRDSCWYAPIALQQSIEMIKDTISPKSYTDSCSPSEKTVDRGQVIAVVGPGSSSVALQVQNLLQLFSIPQIGYSTTSKDLSDRGKYRTFMRVVPSDYYQAKVIVDIVKKFNWNYVSIVSTNENYGQSGIQAFRELADKDGVCIARSTKPILSNDEEEKYNEIMLDLKEDKKANVVVCFCEGMTIQGLLKAIKRLALEDRFLLIGTDGWADRADVVEGYEKQALGSISIRIHSPRVESFDDYYFALNPFTNHRNPWFQELWEYKFNCTMPANSTSRNYKLLSTDRKSHCTGNESLNTTSYRQEPKLSFLVKAIYTIAYGLQALHQSKCGHDVTNCDAIKKFWMEKNGTEFLEYLKNVSFVYPPNGGDIIEFDSIGEPPGRYDIINYQQTGNGTYEYVKVGEWKNGTLNLTEELPVFETRKIFSVCSEPCKPGSYREHQSVQDKKCCWVCLNCESDQFLYNETHCQTCPKGEMPTKNITGCIKMDVKFVKWNDLEAIISIATAVFGFIITSIVLIIIVQYNNTPVVKASTRELCYLILVGMMLSHISILFFIAQPNQIFCAINRILPGISFSMIYASLFVKTNRIARILAGSKKRFPTRKPRFMSAGAQLLLTSILILIEATIATMMVIYEPANSIALQPDRSSSIKVVVLKCNTTELGVLSPLGFIFFLIGMCTLYALKTRNVPENFNEAKFIGFAMYTTCVIWVAFVPIYFGSESKIITQCLSISLSSMVTLIFLFFPKLYIILIRPEKNIRALFTTSKSIRCHIGSRVASAISHKTSSSFSSCPGHQESDYDREIRLPKPINRSSSCQTSMELLYALLELQGQQQNVDVNCKPPAIGWSELNIKDLSKLPAKIDQYYDQSPTNYDQNNRHRQTNQIKTNIYENSVIKIKNFIPNRKNQKLNQHRMPSGESSIETRLCVPTSVHNENNSNVMKTLTESLENLNRKNKHEFLNGGIEPIFTIDSPTNNCTNLIKTTISEESLSECSLSESCDCKLKSITIRIASPNLKI